MSDSRLGKSDLTMVPSKEETEIEQPLLPDPSLDASAFSATGQIPPGYHFPSYEATNAYGYYAPHNSASLYNPTEDWTEYMSRLGKQGAYHHQATSEGPSPYLGEETSYFPQSRPLESYLSTLHYSPSQQYTSQGPSGQYAEGQYYQPYLQSDRPSSYGLSTGYPQHFLQPIDQQYAHIFPGVLPTPETKLKVEQKQAEEAYSPGLYRVTNSFSQLSFPSEGIASTHGLVNGTFSDVNRSALPLAQGTIPEQTPAGDQPLTEQKKSYVEVVQGSGPTRARLATPTQVKPKTLVPLKTRTGPVPNGLPATALYRKRIPQPVNLPVAPEARRPVNPLAQKLGVNPETFDINPTFARFFVIKSYSADDVHKSIKYGVWTSTKHGNKRLDQAYQESSQKGPIYLFFSVNGSGCFCGLAQMTSSLDFEKTFAAWAQDDKWSGQFSVKWIYIKNIPNKRLRPIRLVNNNNKSVTNSRDTQEVFLEPGKQVLKVFHTFEHNFSILDDFETFDRLEESKKKEKELKALSSDTTKTEEDQKEKEPSGPAIRGRRPQKPIKDFVPVHGDDKLKPKTKLSPASGVFHPVGTTGYSSFPRARFQVKKPKPTSQS